MARPLVVPSRLRLAALGMVVHPRSAWPFVRAKFRRVGPLPRGAVLHTVQPHVYTRFINEKVALIEGGTPLPVKAFQVGGVWWSFDGHHTFAAYVFLDRAPVLAVFGLDDGGDVIEPPKLFPS